MRFVIQDLDETHLLVSTERVEWMRSELEQEVRRHHFGSMPHWH